MISLPFKETGYFASDKPMAVSYRVRMKRGERLVIGAEVKAARPTQIFVELFEIPDNGSQAPKHLASADTASNVIDHESEEDRTYLIRLQPELLRSGNYTLTISREPSLAFPVQGKNSRNISSFWGADRDGGKRRHEGIDIFAKRGTPAVASADGYIRGVNENRLGGKVVWLYDTKRQQTLYYAHLDEQLVRPGQRVVAGDTIGLIGNTGNARTTDPHLHFGIYTYGRGAVDPFPFVRAGSPAPAKITAPIERLGTWARISAKSTTLWLSPDLQSSQLSKLARHTPVYVLGGVKDWYKVSLPDNRVGYLQAKQLENADKPIRVQKVVSTTQILDQPAAEAAFLATVEPGAQLPVLASYGEYLYVKTPEGLLGWIPTS
jgi:murein DD-endopeptidase MepM/ murein hydrolase activator NlpD/SH3-like domain-containing protein